MAARSKRERAERREDKASGHRERKNSERTGKRGGMMQPAGAQRQEESNIRANIHKT
jgi:hypothetical protein